MSNIIVVKEFFDYKFIKKSMSEYGVQYNKEDLTLFDSMIKTCYGAYNNDNIIAFGCLCHVNGNTFMTYTWNNGTISGKKGYSKGFSYMLRCHKDIIFLHGAKKLNRVRRLLDEK